MSPEDKLIPKRRVREVRDQETLSNPLRVWADLRAAGASAMFDGCPVAAHRDDVMAVLSDPEQWISGGRLDLGSSRRLIPQEIDPPEHRRYRRLLEPVFAPKEVRLMEPAIRAMAVRMIDEVVPAGSCDLVSTVALLAPTYFAVELLDLPESRVGEMLRLKDAILHPTGSTDEKRQSVKRAAGEKIEAMMASALDQRLANPGSDLFSRVTQMEIEGDRLSREETLAIYYNFFIAGLDSVAAMTTCMFAFLAESPEHRKRIVEDPAVIPNAVEEMLRRESVVETIARVASSKCEYHGHTLEPGESVVISLGAANHDPEWFAEPEKVDFDRNANKHLAFAAGIHRCIGLHLARLELAIVLEEWHARIPDYWMPKGTVLTWVDSPIRTVEKLPLEWK